MWPCTYDFESQEGHTQGSRYLHCVSEAMHGLSVWEDGMARFINNLASMNTCTRFSLDDEECS